MTNGLKILVCEDNHNITESYKIYFADKNISVEFCSKNGNLLLDKICSIQPDVIICELFLSEYDAIAVIEKALRMDNPPQLFFATSAIDNDDVIRRALDSGFNFFFVKPYSLENIFSKIELMLQYSHKPSAEGMIVNILHRIEMPGHLKGFNCIKDGISLLLKNPGIINNVTKELYPQIAALNNTTASRVERAIRTAIETAWMRGNEEWLGRLFPYHFKNYIKPSNSEFMACIADYIKTETHKTKSS